MKFGCLFGTFLRKLDLWHISSPTLNPLHLLLQGHFCQNCGRGVNMLVYQSHQKLLRYPLDSAEVLPAWLGASVLSTCFLAEGCKPVTKAWLLWRLLQWADLARLHRSASAQFRLPWKNWLEGREVWKAPFFLFGGIDPCKTRLRLFRSFSRNRVA